MRWDIIHFDAQTKLSAGCGNSFSCSDDLDGPSSRGIHTHLISRRILPKAIVEFRVEKDKMSCQSSKIQRRFSDSDRLFFF